MAKMKSIRFNQSVQEVKVTWKVGVNQYSIEYLQQLSRDLVARMKLAGLQRCGGSQTGSETIHYFCEDV